ncbi:MAG: hypothetical protein MZV70_58495 [Desulfobacterales bacterium]|nr:hypothetical protein [Desulfobacterales bacterium]
MLILLLILLLPVSSSVAENLTCSSLPLLKEEFLSNHYAMKNMTGEIKTHAVDQMIKSLDPSKTLLYESDLERLRPVLQDVFACVQAGDCASLQAGLRRARRAGAGERGHCQKDSGIGLPTRRDGGTGTST